ncbi:MAG TPA: SRPBCC family protein [Candidatus Angelobacter sp.]|nr:SRPBCC family protein [Candidatus Angelobacter sp.]
MKITASAERRIDAPASRVHEYIADFRQHHPHILPAAFSDLVVEEGGYGAGTIARFTLTAGGRSSTARIRVDEPEPGRVLTETQIDGQRQMVTTFLVEGEPRGTSRVRIHTELTSTGPRAIAERLVVPRMLRGLYREELELLAAYARERSRTAPRIMPSVGRGFVVG